MNLSITKASVIGRGHILSAKNNQDYINTWLDEDNETCLGVVCDGCGSGRHTEFGSILTGQLVVNALHDLSVSINDDQDCQWFAKVLQDRIVDSLKTITKEIFGNQLNNQNTTLLVNFFDEYLLSTFLFYLVKFDRVIIGHCGDGIVIINDEIIEINQSNKPNYIAYKCLKDNSNFLTIKSYSLNEINRLAIATDGLEPLIQKPELVQKLFEKNGIQMQLFFNVLQSKERFFYDDTTCITLKKSINEDENVF